HRHPDRHRHIGADRSAGLHHRQGSGGSEQGDRVGQAQGDGAKRMNFLESIEQLGFSTWVRESPSKFAYPTILWLHVMGMGVVAGTSGIISLRLLGISPKTPLQELDRLYPLMWFGFW